MKPDSQPWWSTRPFALLLVLAAAIPLIGPAVPPLTDLPGHMGRYAVELAPEGSPLLDYFAFHWEVIGNLGVDLLIIPMSWLFGLELGVKLIVLAVPPLTVAGMLLVAREAHGELPSTVAFALPLAYGYPFQFGFINFALSMALALIAFGLWLRLGRTGRLRLRAALFVPVGIIVWFAHSFGWGVLGLLAFGSELVRAHQQGRNWWRSCVRAAVMVLPLVPPMVLMLLWRSGGVAGTTGDWFNWDAKLYYLLSVLRNDGTGFDTGSAAALIVLAAAGALGIGFRRQAVLLVAGLVLLATFVLLPRIALGSAYADMRLAPFMLAVILLSLAPARINRTSGTVLALIAVTFFGVRLAAQTQTYQRLDRVYAEQLEALEHLPQGSRVFALTNLKCLNAPYLSRLDHIEAMALVRRQSFANGQWAMAGAQLLRITLPGAEGFTGDPTQIIRPLVCRQPGSYLYPEVLHQFPRSAFDYLWLINFPAPARPVGDPGLLPVWEGERGGLYRVMQTPSADSARR